MSNLDELQTRREIFREAGQNLRLNPLVTQADFQRLGVDYQTQLIDELVLCGVNPVTILGRVGSSEFGVGRI
jgi:hypothetical protein